MELTKQHPSIDLKENYCALAIAAMRGMPPEQAFSYLNNKDTNKIYPNFTAEDVKEMTRLHREEKMTYKKLSQIYGISMNAVCKRIRRYEKYGELPGAP